MTRCVRVARPAAAAALTLLAAACGGNGARRAGGSPAPAPRPIVGPGDAQYRYQILRSSDTTFAFVAPSAAWLRPGVRGIVVDPRRNDALVARFQAIARRADTVVALITGQTTDVAMAHVALLAQPPRPGALRQRAFWLGVLAGGAIGAGAALIAR